MAKQKKSVYILGSMLIGIVTVLAVLLILAGTGVIDTKSRDVVFTSATVQGVYDGNELKSDEWKLTSGELKNGHTAKVTVSGAQLNVGSSENHISVVIVDEQGADVSENYNIRCIAGTLTVTACHYELKSAGAEKVYDGKPLTAESYTVVSGELPDGHDIAVTYTGEITNVGVEQNKFSAIIRDSKNRDVTDNFALVCTPGRLEVTKRAITFKSENIEKVYDGIEIKSESADITDSRALADDQRVEYEFTQSITSVGSVQNMFTAKIFSADNTEVTDNYDVTYDIGTLTVTSRPITVESGSAIKVYDGQPLTVDDGALVENSLAEGEVITITTTGKRTDVGVALNTFDVEIKNADGEVTTSNYDITKNRGELEVKPLEIIVSTANGSKPYDGDELTMDFYHIDGETIGSDVISVQVTGSQTTVGSSENTVTVDITNSAGESKKYNYTIIEKCGTLTVTPYTVTVRTGDYTGVYSGEAQTYGGWGIVTADGIVEDWKNTGFTESMPGGGNITVHVTGSRTDVGTSANVFAVAIADENGDTAIAANYNVVKEEGTITVTPRPLTVCSIDGEWDYDGEPHSTRDVDGAVYCAEDTPLVEGHELAPTVKTIAERTDVGVSSNRFSAVKIIDEEYNDVTKNYDISKEPGILNVRGKSGVKLGGGSDDDSIRLWLYSDESETVYLRMQSYGDFDGQYFWSAEEYDSQLNNNASLNYLPSYALQNSGAHVRSLDIKLETGTDFVLPYYAVADGEYLQTSDVYYYGSAINYTIDRYAYSYTNDDGANIKNHLTGAYSTAEGQYRTFVYENYLYVPESTKTYLNGIIADEGFNKSNPDIISAVASYIQNAATYNLDYNKGLDYQLDIVIGFLRDYKEGICQHYAASATMLYRTLGIPARYVIGYLGYTKANAWNMVTANQGHAWVEVYINGVGWVQVEVTGGGPDAPDDDYGQGEPQAGDEFTIKPVERFKKYDGTPLNAQNRVQGISKLLEHGYTYSVSVSGSRTQIGYGSSTIMSLTISDPSGNVAFSYSSNGTTVNNTLFKFNVEQGKLHVYNYLIALRTDSSSRMYNGDPLSNPGYQLINSTKLESGHRFSDIVMGSITDVGIAANTFTAKVLDSTGNDITDEYRIEVAYGTLEVNAIAITVRTHGKTVTSDELDDDYDGNLTCGYYDILNADGDVIVSNAESGKTMNLMIDGRVYRIECELGSSQSRVGSSVNTVDSISLVDINSYDMSPNFAVSYEYGKLIVTR